MANNLIVCGGTFDHFHKGHISLLKLAFSLEKNVIIGVTSDQYAGSLKMEDRSLKGIESFEKRKQAVSEFAKKENVFNRAEVIEINDLFGPTLSENLLISTVVVSSNTKKGADIINERRKELGLGSLKVIIVPSVKAEDGKLISSARIRNGEINREGKLYIKPLWLKADLILPKDLREEFKKPFGTLGFDLSKQQKQFVWIVSVGDVTTKNLNQLCVNQKISVVDFKVARKETFSSFSDIGFYGNERVIIAKNPAGYITHDLFLKVLDIFKYSFKKRIILKITGEEDLAVLPLVLAAPLNTIIYYGQPGQGIVAVEVSEKIKETSFRLVDRFKEFK